MATRTAAAPTRAAAPALSLEERLALRGLAMGDRLAGAHGDMAIRTVGIDTEALEILAAPTPAAAQPPATVADVYQEAARLINAHGWIRKYVGRPETGYCLIGAIRAAAGGNRKLEDAAETQMLDRIRRQAPDALSIGQWNDVQSGPAPVIRMLGS